ncbi:hypothetical protein [Halopelagius longus]|uniref:Rubrerythrin-like domain-containing protein n=1 Tax=Halopelagius longus TaxID=1236180 RepID=A0A1H0YI81_9EURY|nr:hypothetical protein [Halopelagius longus]RDI72506.1 hypothetical protein DWB78_12685 [Halopelagius longus]SDQ14872.1 hypothetical protein SAMN05216278_0652 [Halopelagius longus]
MNFVAEYVRSVGGWFRGTDAEESRDDAEATPAEGPRASLFQCSDCGSVYVATDKETCSTCNEAVEQIPSTV